MKIDVLRVRGELVALVVDLLDVALGARRADDVGRVGDPVLEPVEALLRSCPRAARRRRGSRGCARWRRRRGSSCRSTARPPGGAVGSNWPVTMRGARHPYAASTLWASIIGKRLPSATTICASTPVSSAAGRRARARRRESVRRAPLYQCTRKRFSGCGLVRRRRRRAPADRVGIRRGSASWANVGSAISSARQRSICAPERVDEVLAELLGRQGWPPIRLSRSTLGRRCRSRVGAFAQPGYGDSRLHPQHRRSTESEAAPPARPRCGRRRTALTQRPRGVT